MSANVKILIACHKDTDYIKGSVWQPIQLGCANTQIKLENMLQDNVGENISELNPMYCELTAQYWAWKNLDADYYGFCHYRRYFSFSEQNHFEDAYGNVVEKYLDDSAVETYGLDDATVQNLVEKYDIITTTRKNLRNMPGRFSSVKDQYERAPLLHGKDLQVMLDIIDEKYPEYSKAAHQHCDGHITSFCNMYILKKEIFFDYCQWMFDVLGEFCKRVDMSNYSTEALRTPGHLSERLFGIYYLHLMEKKPELRTKELQCVFFEHTEKQSVLAPAFSENSVPVVFAANDCFVPMFATCMKSVLDHISPKYNYDLVLLQSDVTADNKKQLLKMVEGIDNVSLRFFDAARLLKNYKLKANAHISVETYYRFIIQAVLPDYDKILYLDCDLVANADVAELYNTDVEGYMLAAARDPDFLGQINGANLGTKLYCEQEFKMKDPYNYFQAGVLLFNEKEMRKAYSLDEWLTFASTPYKYNDQDVLNLYCEGKVKYLDMAWNMITDCDHTRVSQVIVYAPASVQAEYKKAHANPKLIHYAGFMKPWHRPTEDYAFKFWETARRTPYYEELLFRMADGVSYWTVYENNKRFGPARIKNKLKCGIKKVGNKLFPKGTVRREKMKVLLKRG